MLNKKNVVFGQKLKALRVKNKITQEALCEKLGCTVRALHRWEKGLSYPLSVYHPLLLQIIPEMSQKWTVV